MINLVMKLYLKEKQEKRRQDKIWHKESILNVKGGGGLTLFDDHLDKSK